MDMRPDPIEPPADSTEGGSGSVPLELRTLQGTRLECVGGQRLLVERGAQEDLLTLVSSSGDIVFSVRITPSGPVLRFESGLRIEASGALEFSGKSLELSGEEGVNIRSGGDATIHAVGDLSSTARIQNLTARLGNVNLKANDDVRLIGERVRLNC